MSDIKPWFIRDAVSGLYDAAYLMDDDGDDELASHMRSLAELAETIWDEYEARLEASEDR